MVIVALVVVEGRVHVRVRLGPQSQRSRRAHPWAARRAPSPRRRPGVRPQGYGHRGARQIRNAERGCEGGHRRRGGSEPLRRIRVRRPREPRVERGRQRAPGRAARHGRLARARAWPAPRTRTRSRSRPPPRASTARPRAACPRSCRERTRRSQAGPWRRRTGRGPSDAEVQYLHVRRAVVSPREEQVLGLQVPVHAARRVRPVERHRAGSRSCRAVGARPVRQPPARVHSRPVRAEPDAISTAEPRRGTRPRAGRS
jgi:hypothetical protein